MFDIGWSELLLIGTVSLIVVGPKDLPGMFRTLGRFTAKARAMGREFQRAMDDAARETGVKETADELRAMTTKKSLGLDALEQAANKFEKWQPTKGPTAAKGPATQALADKKAAEAAARKAALTAPKEKTGTSAANVKGEATGAAKAAPAADAASPAVPVANGKPAAKAKVGKAPAKGRGKVAAKPAKSAAAKAADTPRTPAAKPRSRAATKKSGT